MPPVTCPDHPRQWPSCLNGVCVVSAVGLTQLGFWAGVGAAFLLPAPGEPPSRPGGIQNLSGSQTVFRGALGARKDGARGDVGGCRCLCLLCGSPSYKEGLLEAWAGPCPPVPGRHRDDAQAEGSVSTKASPPPRPPVWLFRCALGGGGTASWGRVESASWVRRANTEWRAEGWVDTGGRCSRHRASPGCLLPGVSG